MSASHTPAADPQRKLLHTRSVALRVFERSDGHFDVEATLLDVKDYPMKLASGVRPAGEPIHAMQLNLVVDRHLEIKEASSHTTAMPYAGQCEQHGNAYTSLIGLNLMQGFRGAVRERLSGTKGCTHLTELCGLLPTAVLQAFAGYVLDTREGASDDQAPFQLDRCHALRRDGPVVQTYYPRWFRAGSP